MAADDLTLAPDFVLAETDKFTTLVSQFENNVEQRRAKVASAYRTWKLQYRNRTATELSTLQTLFNTKKGQLTSFLWTNPLDSTQYTVRFASDEIEYQLKAYGIYDFQFNLKQVV